MTATLSDQRPAATGTEDGGVPARRAVIHWAWRLTAREWRQQALIVAMLALAVAATIWGAGVATNTPPSNPNAAAFGTASALLTLPGTDPHLAADIAAVQRQYGPGDVIESQDLSTGLAQSVQLRAQDPAAPYGGPLLALVQGRYPSGPGQVAMTSQLASLYGLTVGGSWHEGGQNRRLTGLVENPANLLDAFALVAPGQVSAPTQVTILLGPAAAPDGPGPGQRARGQRSQPGLPAAATVSFPSQNDSAAIPPATIVLVVAMLGLIFIGLVATAGFTVMAQRRLRALGMLSALGATERNVRLVMMANGAVVGVTAAFVGAAAGFAAWFAYAPTLQSATAHRVDPLNLPWWAVAVGIVLAVATAVLAARRPARTIARLAVVSALSGRPAPPKAVHRAAGPGVGLLAAGVIFLFFSGGWTANSNSAALLVLMGLAAIIVGCFLLAPLCVAVLTRFAGPRAPVAVRIALRDLVRYRARSGAALAATTFAVFLSVLICVIASVRFSNVLDWTGPNLSSSQLIVYTAYDPGPTASAGLPPTQAQLNALHARVDSFAASLHAQSVVALDSAGTTVTTPTATLVKTNVRNNNYSGPLYIATPALLRAYGIDPGTIKPGTDILTMRPGLPGTSDLQLLWGQSFSPDGPQGCLPSDCLAHPVIQTESSLPAGTSAPNTVITVQAVQKLHLNVIPDGWLIQTPAPLTATQISAARQLAVGAGATIATKSGELGLNEISDGATAVGLLIALGVLVMTVGLIRSETARDLRTLTAAGASGGTRRTITAATAGAIGLLGALLGTAGAAIAGVAWARSSLSTTFGNIPAVDLVVILVGLPLVAAAGGWLLAGRQPAAIARQPLE